MRSFVLSIIFACLVPGLVGCSRTDVSQAPAHYTVLDEHASQLRDDFNRYAGSVRLIFVIDPACGGCLRGLDDIDRDLLATTTDPRMETFIVHVPVIGGEEKHVPSAATLAHNDRVHHYWNPSGQFGDQLARGAGLESDGELVYAWDVWSIYGPDAVWSEEDPPSPLRLMHQLWVEDLDKFPALDSKVFAEEVHTLMAQMPPLGDAQSVAQPQ